MITQFLPKSQVWKRLWKITFCGLKRTGSGLGEPGGTTPPRIPRSTPTPSPGAGPSITYLFRLEWHLLFVQVRSPFLEKPGNFSGSKANFEIKTGPGPWSRTYLTWSLKQVFAFFKFCTTLGQQDFKIHVVSVLVFLLIAGARSHFYINTSLIRRFYILRNKLNTTKYSSLPCFYFSENKYLF